TELGGLGWFVGVWATMMAAMMLPSLAPLVARRRPTVETSLFTAGYLLAWIAAGLVAYALFEGLRSVAPAWLAWDDGGRYVAGGVILAAALYELTPLKRVCLRHCRNPEPGRPALTGALASGVAHAGYSLGCRLELMAAPFPFVAMSLSSMI